MLSKSTIKSVTALHQKKFRREQKLFIAEGEKVINDLLTSGWGVVAVYGTQEFFQRIPRNVKIPKRTEVELVSPAELTKLSALSSPQSVLAVVEMPEEEKEINYASGLKLVLDEINDPGNMGTLIRIADWFGVKEIICSENTVDCFNPKVVQSAMGSLFRIGILYKDLSEIFLSNLGKNNLAVFGTVLDGKNIYNEELDENGFILLGNESAGITSALLKFITKPITVPSFEGSKADSLNVAVATGIICNEFRRRM